MDVDQDGSACVGAVRRRPDIEDEAVLALPDAARALRAGGAVGGGVADPSPGCDGVWRQEAARTRVGAVGDAKELADRS